jgi:hypothetical protein
VSNSLLVSFVMVRLRLRVSWKIYWREYLNLKEVVMEEWRKLHNEELHKLYLFFTYQGLVPVSYSDSELVLK